MTSAHAADHQGPPSHGGAHGSPYLALAGMTALSFVSMYVLMYAMVDEARFVYNSLNQVYMAALMTAPMALIELALMRRMYRDTPANLTIAVVAVVVLLASFFAIRQQVAIGDRQFIRSMIPHHSDAVLMCGQAPIADAELKALCAQIIRGQQAEINQMEQILRRLDGAGR